MSIRLDISTSINLNISNDGYTYILNFIIIYEKSKCDVKFFSSKYAFVWPYTHVVATLLFLYQIRTRSKDEITKLSEALATLTPSKFSDNDLSGYKVLYYFRAGVS